VCNTFPTVCAWTGWEVGGYEGGVSTPAPKVVVFLPSGEYDRVHQGWALERFLQGRLDEPDFTPPREVRFV